MSDTLLSELSPISFLQMFVTQSVKLAGQTASENGTDHYTHIQYLGLTASSCLEAHARRLLYRTPGRGTSTPTTRCPCFARGAWHNGS